MATIGKEERIAKVIARAGMCSRREAERWIAEGRVKVDGVLLDTPAFKVSFANKILIDDEPLKKAEPTRVWLFYKPRGVITSSTDPEDRRTIFDILPEELANVKSVGRLDYNSEGLLLLTNNGELARHMELPSTGWVRKYKVRAFGKDNPEIISESTNGVEIEGIIHTVHQFEVESRKGNNFWSILSLKEGKNREIRKIFEYYGFRVSRLIRTSYGSFSLGRMKEGQVKEVSERIIKDQFGSRI